MFGSCFTTLAVIPVSDIKNLLGDVAFFSHYWLKCQRVVLSIIIQKKYFIDSNLSSSERL